MQRTTLFSFLTSLLLGLCILTSPEIQAESRPADCPSGYTNTGLFCTRGTDDYARTRPANCPKGYTNVGLDCQKGANIFDRVGSSKMTCPSGYSKSGSVCSKACKAGYTNMGLTCHRPLSTLTTSSMTCRSNELLLGSTGRCYKVQKHGQGCWADAPCGDGLSCQPGVHKCYNSPRKAGEPCSAGYGCVDGLYCQSFLHKCVPKTIDYNSNSPCGALRVQATAEDAKRANLTMSFSAGSAGGVGVFASYETGLVYGNKGEFGCFATACVGQQIDANISNYANFGIYNDYKNFEGFSIVTGGGADVPFVELGFQTSQVWSSNIPKSANDFAKNQLIGTASGLSFGVGVNPVNVNYAYCVTEVLDDDSPVSGLKSLETSLKQWANGGFAPDKKPTNVTVGGSTSSVTTSNNSPRPPTRPQSATTRIPQLSKSTINSRVANYYNQKSEWSGQYVISRVIRSRSVNVNAKEKIVHVEYKYRGKTNNQAGIDKRTFRFKYTNQWNVISMGGNQSASF